MVPWVVWLAGGLLVLIAGVVAGWRVLARRHTLPCPTACLWLLENRMMDRVAGGRVLLDRAGVQAGMTVLDAGCGPGRLTLPLAERVGPQGRVVALDLQEAMLSRLKARLQASAVQNVEMLHAGLGSGKLPAGEFDRAFLVTVLGEIPDRLAALREIRASLKPGGILSVTEVFPDPHFQGRGTVQRLGEQAGFRVGVPVGTWRAFTVNLSQPGGALPAK